MPMITVALVDVLGGTEVKWVLVGGMRFVAHHRARVRSDPPGLWAGSNPPFETALDQGRKPRSTARPPSIWCSATRNWPPYVWKKGTPPGFSFARTCPCA